MQCERSHAIWSISQELPVRSGQAVPENSFIFVGLVTLPTHYRHKYFLTYRSITCGNEKLPAYYEILHL